VISLNSGLAKTPAHSHISSRTIPFASIIWASSIFLSRIMGLLREQIIAQQSFSPVCDLGNPQPPKRDFEPPVQDRKIN
jgi:hypothetical protein